MARLNEKFAQQAKLLGEIKAPANGGSSDVSASAGRESPQYQRTVLTDLPIEQIERDPDQPRKDLGDLSGLTESITELGIVQPIIVTVAGYNAYRIVAGERRYTAARAAGLTSIPAIVRSVEEQERLAMQLIENLHRKDLNPFEEAQSYQRLMDEFRFTQKDIAKRLGKTQGSISEMVRLLDLPPAIQRDYPDSTGGSSGGRITKSLLLEIAKVPVSEQTTLWEAAKRGELTVKQARAEKQATSMRSGAREKGDVAAAVALPAKETRPTMTFRFPIQTSEAVVTVAFDKPKASFEEIIAALEEALVVERARVNSS